jgi:hypothetical protein
VIGADGVQQQPHLDAGAGFLDQQIAQPGTHAIRLPQVVFEMNVVGNG